MVGQWRQKPSRSDEVLDADQQLRIAEHVRTHYESLAPKRPAKPNRSESDSPHAFGHQQLGGDMPELQKFQSLQSQSQGKIVGEGGGFVQDEFVETGYYKELESIDKQHHTTGTGFIKMMNEVGENGYDLQLQGSCEAEKGRVVNFSCFRTNPARNDWAPST